MPGAARHKVEEIQMVNDHPIPKEKLLYVIGQGSVRVEIVESLYGVCEVQPVHHCYSKLEGEVGTNNRYDYFEIDELIHCLQQAKTYLRQKSGNASVSAAPVVNHQ
jgi:hypothetical protein